MIIKTKKGDVGGIIGAKPPHLQKAEEKKKVIKHGELFIDIGAKDRNEAKKIVAVGDPVILEPNFGKLNKNTYYGKAVDNRLGCYALVKIMRQVKPKNATIYAVATAQEVGTDDFRISTQGGTGDADFDAQFPDIAYNSTSDEYLVVWHGDRVVGEREIYGQRVDADGTLLGGAFRISDAGVDDDTLRDAQNPAVAYNATTDEFDPAAAHNPDTGEYLVVWQDYRNLGHRSTDIYGQRVSP